MISNLTLLGWRQCFFTTHADPCELVLCPHPAKYVTVTPGHDRCPDRPTKLCVGHAYEVRRNLERSGKFGPHRCCGGVTNAIRSVA